MFVGYPRTITLTAESLIKDCHMKSSQLQRLFDFTCAAIGLLVLWPVLVVVALVVKLHDGGPVFFRAKRVGKGGKPFNLLKFRGMIADADKLGPALTARDDNRITPIGRVLRKLKVDELPQLFNVLKGDMSLVGPRPEDPKFVALYTPEQRKVLECRPGMTSPVSLYLRNEESLFTGRDWVRDYCERILPHKLKTELAYAQQRTILSDVMVILETILSIVILNKRFLRMILSLRNRHFLVMDVLFALVAPAIGLVVRLDGFKDFGTYLQPLAIYTISALVIKIAIFLPAKFYDRYWQYAGVRDAEVVVVAGLAAWGTLIVLFFGILQPLGLIASGFPRLTPFVDGAFTMFQVSAVRFLARLSFEHNEQLRTVTLKKRVAIVGAGAAGSMIVKAMLTCPSLKMEPVGFFDDDAHKCGMRIHGIDVLGTIADIPNVLRQDSLDEVVIALPSAPAEVVRKVVLMCETMGVTAMTISRVFEILEETPQVSDIPAAEMADLLHKDAVETKAGNHSRRRLGSRYGIMWPS
jgi:lipopolysaccharide/colanic/teichoic acid biosynthesis glycosyltransferase